MMYNERNFYMPTKTKRSLEPIIFLVIFLGIFCLIGSQMGAANMLSTMMNTAYALLMDTVFYIMAIAVLAGAVSALLSEFGVVDLINKLVSPLMKPLFGLPGAASLGIITTYLSDNPAILALANDGKFRGYFKKYQLPALTNLGTAFGMGFVVIITMMSFGYAGGALVGLLGAFCGSIISTRIMQRSCLKAFPETDSPVIEAAELQEDIPEEEKTDEKKSVFLRFLNSILDGGKNGVELGLAIIPGVLIITTMVILITFGAGPEGYTGAANQGVPILPWLAGKVHWVFEWLFGFQDMRLIAFPMTALGAVGASLGLLPTFNEAGILDGNAIAVFTAIGMCWSGFLSTHTAMLDTLGARKAISKALGAHTVAGLCAGVIAHFVYLLVSLI